MLPNCTKGSGSESVSQLQSVSYVTLLSASVQPYRLSSRSVSLCGRHGVFFKLHTHYWSFWWVMPLWLKYILYFYAGPQNCFNASTGCRPRLACACTLGFQEPCANTEWEDCHLMIQHSVYEWVRLQSVSMQPQHTSWKLAFACVCSCICACQSRPWNTEGAERDYR